MSINKRILASNSEEYNNKKHTNQVNIPQLKQISENKEIEADNNDKQNSTVSQRSI